MTKRMYRVTLTIDVPTDGTTEDEHRKDLAGNLYLRTGMAVGSLSRQEAVLFDAPYIQLTIPGEAEPIGTATIERYRSAG